MDPAIIKATGQGAALSAFSNVLGQAIGCYQDNRPITINYADLAIFTVFAILNIPPNYLWQIYLEDTFPGYTKPAPAPPSAKDKGYDKDYSANPTMPATPLNKRNTAIKFALDQTVGAAVNTILFLGGMALLRGQGLAEALRQSREGFWPLIFAGQKLWPFVSIAMFTLVPAEARTVVGSIVGMFWNIYLTLVSGKRTGRGH